jgi:hypothetical protein
MTKIKQNKERKILVRLTEESANEFINHCDNNGYTMSKRIRLLIEKDLKGKLIIND